MTKDALAPLRITVQLAVWCGIAALGTAHLLSPSLAAGAALLSAAAAASCSAQQSTAARQARKSIGLVVLLGAFGSLAVTAGGGQGPAGLARAMPPLLLGVLLAQGLSADKRHDIMVSLTVAAFMLVLAAGISPSASLVAPLLAGWVLAVVALVQSHQLHAAECSAPALQATAVTRSTALRTALRAAAAAVAVGLLLFLVIPHPSESAAHRRRSSGAAAAGDNSPEGALPRLSAGNLNLDMRTRGDLGRRPVALVPGDSPQLWRNGVFVAYDGMRWNAEFPRSADRPAGDVLTPDPLDGGIRPAGAVRVDAVEPLVGFDTFLISPGVPLAVAGASPTMRFGAARITVMPRPYVVTSAEQPTAPEQLDAATGDDITGNSIQLPASLPARLRELAASITAGAPTRREKVEAVAAYLGRTKSYSLHSRVPKDGTDAVDDFVFNAPSGFCEQFAAAEVVLLRTLGIPARMAVGYAYGAAQESGERLFTSANSHAWVEVWYPGLGWSPNDPTPPGVQQRARHTGNALMRLVRWVTKQLSTSRGRLALAAVLVFAAGLGWCVLLLRSRLRRRPPTSAPAVELGAASGLLAAFNRLEVALSTDGRPRAVGETLSELERRLAADAPGRHALRTLETAIYSPQLVSPADARSAAHTFDALAAATLATHSAREQLAGSIGVRR